MTPKQILEKFRKAQYGHNAGSKDETLAELEEFYTERFESVLKAITSDMKGVLAKRANDMRVRARSLWRRQ